MNFETQIVNHVAAFFATTGDTHHATTADARELTERAETHAVEVFVRNLRKLLLQPPVQARHVLAIDPGLGEPTYAAWFKASGPRLLTGMIIAALFIIWIKDAIRLLHNDELEKERIGLAVGRFLPAICLIDGMAAAAGGTSFIPALICVGCFLLSILLQKWVPGT